MRRYVDPERDQFDAFKALPRDVPVMMLNLVLFRDRASYPDGRDATGADAYAAYGRESAPVFKRVGGEIVWRGRPERMVIGPAEKRWDLVFVARYPTANAFLEMVRHSEAKGVIFSGEKFCEYEYFEFPYLEKRLKEIGIPTLMLEFSVDDTENVSAYTTRVEAFAEMLQ